MNCEVAGEARPVRMSARYEVSPPEMKAFWQAALTADGWRLVSDDGSMVIYERAADVPTD